MIIMILDRFGKNESEEMISDEEFISRKEFKKLKRLINAHQYHIENVHMFYNLEPTPLLGDMLKLSYELLRFLDNVCRKHDVIYWIDDDTLLNAIRNGQLMAFSEQIKVAVIQDDVIKLSDAIQFEIDDSELDIIKYDGDSLEISLECPEIGDRLLCIAVSTYEDAGEIVKSSRNDKIERDLVFPLDEIQMEDYTFAVPVHPNDYLRMMKGQKYVRDISKLHDSGKLNQLKSHGEVLNGYVSMFEKANGNFE